MKKLFTATLTILLAGLVLIGNVKHYETCDKVIYGEEYDCTCEEIDAYGHKGPHD